jgi:hypothetical protein
MVRGTASHYDSLVHWSFSTSILYNESDSAIIHEMELVALTGRPDSILPASAVPKFGTIWTSYSNDGLTWSVERSILAGAVGDRAKRLVWFQAGPLGHWRIQRFRGTSWPPLAFSRLDMRIEPLNSKRRTRYG